MKTTEWNDVLSVDVDEIDEDHRKLLDIYHVLNRPWPTATLPTTSRRSWRNWSTAPSGTSATKSG